MATHPQTLQNKLTVRFGVPEHGWLPVMFQAGDFELQFAASNVPNNPLADLCSTLVLVLQGVSAEVRWHLEPDWYYFRFEVGGELCTLIITEEPSHVEISRVTRTIKSLIMPFYRALKGTTSLLDTSEWVGITPEKLKTLTLLAKYERK